MTKLISLIFVAVLFFSCRAFSQQGCSRQNSGNPTIYVDLISGYTNRFDVFGGTIAYNANPPLATCNDFYVSRSSFGTLGTCGIYWGGTKVYNGYLLTYVVSCPIDNYLRTLIFALSILGTYVIRKKTFR